MQSHALLKAKCHAAARVSAETEPGLSGCLQAAGLVGVAVSGAVCPVSDPARVAIGPARVRHLEEDRETRPRQEPLEAASARNQPAFPAAGSRASL